MKSLASYGSYALAAILSLSHPTEATLRPPRISLDTLPSGVRPVPRSPTATNSTTQCRYLPGDSGWPSETEWSKLNDTVEGRLIRGVPLAQTCFGITANDAACAQLEEEWPTVDPYLDDPVTVMCPYWLNNTCSPFDGPNGSCALGNLASYAINVTGKDSIIAGINFAREKNIRLTIKNTGHDILGRSTGPGSLALWTHHLKDVTILRNYTSSTYTGPAIKLGSGIQVHEAYEVASANGLRVAAGGCPTVGVAGWVPGGGHGPLTSQYGLGADEILEYEVVLTNGTYLETVSATENSDLYWALSGGGSGNYAILLSLTTRAHQDGPVAGSTFMFFNTDADAYWAAISAWLDRLLVLDADFPTLKTAVTFSSQFFFLDFATFADRTAAELDAALQPFYRDLDRLGIAVTSNETSVQPDFVQHYDHFSGARPWGVNQTVGNRLIPRSTVRDQRAEFVGAIRNITEAQPTAIFVFVATNVTHGHVGNAAGANSVNPAWRDALLLLNFGRELAPDAGWAELAAQQAEVNSWQDIFRALTPQSGGYLNEGTWDNPEWRTDYFGANYDRLAEIKAKYDPDYFLWTQTAVGNDVAWEVDTTGRMCRR
ncbi:FAD binding domain-containing protein [Biscogniauxia mediterranea]|nr:FAD binding domain-containing protein [Biscogniauxia mediterranea]